MPVFGVGTIFLVFFIRRTFIVLDSMRFVAQHNRNCDACEHAKRSMRGPNDAASESPGWVEMTSSAPWAEKSGTTARRERDDEETAHDDVDTSESDDFSKSHGNHKCATFDETEHLEKRGKRINALFQQARALPRTRTCRRR